MKKVYTLLRLAILVAFVAVVAAQWIKTERKASDTALDYICSFLNKEGDLIDYAGHVGVKGPEDVRIFRGDGSYTIRYGKVKLIWDTEEQFLDEKYTEKLERIGIERKKNLKTGEVEVYYQGEKLDWMVKY